MKARDRVLCALNHQEPDRVPIDLGGTACTSIHRLGYAELRQHLGLEPRNPGIVDPFQQLPFLHEDVLQRFGADVRMLELVPDEGEHPPVVEEGRYSVFHDNWGAKVQMPKDGGLYYDWVKFPIREFTLQALDEYEWPGPISPERLADLRQRANFLRQQTPYALAGTGLIGGGIFEQAATLVGFESLMRALIREPEFADQLMGRITDVYVASCLSYLDAVGEFLDVFIYMDDVCGQEGWLISPDLYQGMIKPKQRRLIETVRQRTDAKIFYHGCGAIFGLIPHLIDIGVDIVNPVQVSARGMDPGHVKREYGRDIVLWGATVDTQHTLPFGTPEEVAEEAKRRIDELAPGGGYVFAPIHNIQPDVPPENVVALFEAALGQ